MTTQAGAAIATAAQPTPGPKKVRARRNWGDLILRVVAGMVLLYLFLPIFVIILFSFNNPAGKFNYTWQGFTLDNWLNPFKYPPLTEALKLSYTSIVCKMVMPSILLACCLAFLVASKALAAWPIVALRRACVLA